MASFNIINVDSDALPRQYTGSGTIKPGMLVNINSSLAAIVHGTAGGPALPRFAIQSHLDGDGITDDYATGTLVQTITAKPGDKILARLANGENAAVAALLESNGDGYLRVVDADASAGDIDVHSIVGQALEAVDMSGSNAVDPDGFILIEVW